MTKPQQDTTPAAEAAGPGTGPQPAAQPDPGPAPAAETLEASEAGQDTPQNGELATLAAECAARTEEIEQEQATRRAAHAEADAAFGIELDADIAARRQSGAPAYADTWRAQILAYCDEARAIVAAMKPHGTEAAA